MSSPWASLAPFLAPPRSTLQVCIYAFDCLYLNGEALLRRPLTERRAALYSALEEQPGKLQFATAKVSRDVEELEVCGATGRGKGGKCTGDNSNPLCVGPEGAPLSGRVEK